MAPSGRREVSRGQVRGDPRPPSARSAEERIMRMRPAARPAQDLPQVPEDIELPTRSIGARWTEGAAEVENTMRLAEEIRRHGAREEVERAC